MSQKLNELVSQQMKLTKNKQMTEEEYFYIASLLGKKNFLVFGTGHDSNIWRHANSDGTTIFLENNTKWILPEDDDVYIVNYTSKLTDADALLEQYKIGNDHNLIIELPEIVKNTKWDIIFVDAPAGNKSHLPGRMQSIYAAKQLSSKDTKVLIHDCDRPVEDTYSKFFFGDNYIQLTKLRGFNIK